VKERSVPDHSTRPVAYSYVRFSTPEQKKGDSLRRQTEAAAAWCQRNGVRLDTATTYHDLGKSAFLGEHRKNPDRNALAAFLKMAEGGKVARGSYLIVENLDRLTREHVRAAVTLFLSILEQGVSIVTTAPERVFRHDSDDMTDVIIAVVELSRGHGESARKSDMVGKSWGQKKRAAQNGEPQPRLAHGRLEGTMLLTRMLPGWLAEKGGRAVAVPERVRAVKRIFALAAAGYGHRAIVQRLEDEGVPPFGQSERWTTAYVGVILRDRRALGEHQPRVKRTGKPDGEPIPDYYPRVIDESAWLAARAGAAERFRLKGRLGSFVNVFQGLVTNARDGESYFAVRRNDEGGPRHVLMNFSHTQGRSPCYAFPLETFERGVLALLGEVDPRQVLGRDDAPDDVMIYSGELAGVEAELGEAVAFMEANGFSATIGKRVQDLEAKKRDVAAKLAEARQRAAHPLSESWGEARSLAAALDGAADALDARLRLRSALRRVVEDVRLLVVPRGRWRLAVAQVYFCGDGSRTYLLGHREARFNGRDKEARKPRARLARSLAAAGLPADALNLRKRAQVKQLEKVLAELEIEESAWVECR
jgi:DNA invertase Pin-like site-specific DNA recombinase